MNIFGKAKTKETSSYRYHLSCVVTIYLCVYYRLDEYKLRKSEEDEMND
jgi:hypothetical protein